MAYSISGSNFSLIWVSSGGMFGDGALARKQRASAPPMAGSARSSPFSSAMLAALGGDVEIVLEGHVDAADFPRRWFRAPPRSAHVRSAAQRASSRQSHTAGGAGIVDGHQRTVERIDRDASGS